MTRSAHARELFAQGKTAREVSAATGLTIGSTLQIKYKPAPTKAWTRITPVIEAAVVAMLKAGRTVADVGRACKLSGASIYDIRKRNGLAIPKCRRYVTADEDSRKGMVACRCGLTLFTEEERHQGHCNHCITLAEFMGRSGESRGSLNCRGRSDAGAG